jgi:hypothetical protein
MNKHMQNLVNKYIRVLAAVFLLQFAATISRGQIDSLQYMKELIRIETALTHRLGEVLKFDAIYYYREVDTVEIRDTTQYMFFCKENKFSMGGGDIHIVQNDDFMVMIDHEEGSMLLYPPSHFYQRLFQVDLFNEQLRQMNLTGVQITDSANIRHISFTCAPDAILASYDLYYDTDTYYPTKIRYKMRKTVYDSGSSYPEPEMISMEVHFFGYASGSASDSVFDMYDIFTRQGGKHIPVGIYASYELIDFTHQ